MLEGKGGGATWSIETELNSPELLVKEEQIYNDRSKIWLHSGILREGHPCSCRVGQRSNGEGNTHEVSMDDVF